MRHHAWKILLAVASSGLLALGLGLTARAAAPGPSTRPTTGSSQPASAPAYQEWPFDAKEAAKRQEETAKALGIRKEIALDLGNKVSMKLILIPAGTFVMGSPPSEKGRSNNEGPAHVVVISKPFYMGVCDVTQAQYEQLIGKNPSHFKGPENPVEMVSWNDAREFCKKLSDKTKKAVSLPTEAQWEYAARAGTATAFYTGDTLSTDQANFDGSHDAGSAKKDNRKKTTPVGTFAANPWGLCDMASNVWNWCSDWYDKDYYAHSPKLDPQGPDRSSDRVVRGGSWVHTSRFCRSAFRGWCGPTNSDYAAGIRVVVPAEGN